GLHEHLVVEQDVLKFNMSPDTVFPFGFTFVWHMQTNHMFFGFGALCSNLWIKLQTPPVVHWDLSSLLLLFAHRIELFRCAETVIRVSVRDKFFGMFFVDWQAFGLLVRRVWTTNINTLVVRNTRPRKRLIDNILGAFNKARAVGILDTNDELPTVRL